MAVSGSLGQGANGEEAVLMSYHNGSSSVRNRWVRTRSGLACCVWCGPGTRGLQDRFCSLIEFYLVTEENVTNTITSASFTHRSLVFSRFLTGSQTIESRLFSRGTTAQAHERGRNSVFIYSSNPTLNEYEMLFPKLEVSPSIITKLWHPASSLNTTEI